MDQGSKWSSGIPIITRLQEYPLASTGSTSDKRESVSSLATPSTLDEAYKQRILRDLTRGTAAQTPDSSDRNLQERMSMNTTRVGSRSQMQEFDEESIGTTMTLARTWSIPEEPTGNIGSQQPRTVAGEMKGTSIFGNPLAETNTFGSINHQPLGEMTASQLHKFVGPQRRRYRGSWRPPAIRWTRHKPL